jgi:hypothetical protein
MKLNINGNEVEIADADLTAAIEANKESIEVKSELIIKTVEQNKLFNDNLKSDNIKIGAEIGRKEVLKGFGIEGDGHHKTDATSIAALTEHSASLVSKALEDAKIEPNKQVETLTSDIETLRGTIKTLEKDKENQTFEFNAFKNTQLISNALSNEVPDNTLLDKASTLTLMNSEIKLDVNENGVVFGVGADGQPMKDPTTAELLPVKTIAANWFNNRNDLLKPSSGGAGGGDSGGGDGKQSMDDFIKEQADAGIQANSPDFNRVMQERMKAGTLEV